MKIDELNVNVTIVDDDGNKVSIKQLKEMVRDINLVNLVDEGEKLARKGIELEQKLESDFDDLEKRISELEGAS